MQERKRRRSRYNYNAIILCALVFFAIGGTVFCMVANSKEAGGSREAAEQLVSRTTAETQAVAGTIRTAVEKQRAISSSVQPGMPVGTTEPEDDKKVVYLTFDDGPSENTKKILDILEQYDAKATFFITGANEDCRHYIKEAYDAGHRSYDRASYIHS